jgi:hypothetical protein
MNKEVIIFIIILVIIGFIYIVYKYINGTEKLKNIKNKLESINNKEKILQYFGGDYCPFSNTDSNAYKVIKDLEDTYGDKVICKYYWVGKDDEYMKKLNVVYVPTILNGNNEQIEIALPDNIDKNNLSNEELRILLLETIYSKL